MGRMGRIQRPEASSFKELCLRPRVSLGEMLIHVRAPSPDSISLVALAGAKGQSWMRQAHPLLGVRSELHLG